MRTPLPILCVSASLMLTSLGCGEQGIGFQAEIPEIPPLPLGLDAELLKVPDGNPITPEKVALGWQLFYDSRLSVDNTISYASCHVSTAGFADPRQGSVGVGGAVGGRQAPPVINAAFNESQFWDGRSPSLEEQALGSIQNPIEMAFTLGGSKNASTRFPDTGSSFSRSLVPIGSTPTRLARRLPRSSGLCWRGTPHGTGGSNCLTRPRCRMLPCAVGSWRAARQDARHVTSDPASPTPQPTSTTTSVSA